MKWNKCLLFLTILALLRTLPAAAMELNQFIAELKARSPEHDGVPLRTYRTEDLNHDGELEVLESVNPIEESATGFLNVELYPAFEWINVYKRKANNYVVATEEFPNFLKNRKSFYLSWLKRLENPSGLGLDSQSLVKDNADDFKRTLNDYIGRINHMLHSKRSNKSLKPTKPAQGDR